MSAPIRSGNQLRSYKLGTVVSINISFRRDENPAAIFSSQLFLLALLCRTR